jgi:hypothetical protein
LISAANLNVHLHGLVLDGVYRCDADGAPSFVEVDAPTDDELHTLLQSLITRLMKLLTRRGVLAPNAKLRPVVVPQGPPAPQFAFHPWTCVSNTLDASVSLF